MAIINIEKFKREIKTSAELIKRINIDKDFPEYYAAAYAIDALENSQTDNLFDDSNALKIEINTHLKTLKQELGAIFEHEKALNLAVESIHDSNVYETEILMRHAKFG